MKEEGGSKLHFHQTAHLERPRSMMTPGLKKRKRGANYHLLYRDEKKEREPVEGGGKEGKLKEENLSKPRCAPSGN